MSPSDALAERRAELARRLAALSPEKRAQLEGARPGTSVTPRRGGIAPREPGAPVPMSYAQELLWLIERANPGMHGYNVPRTLRLRGSLDVAALQAALDGIVARHEVLRSTFDVVDGDPRQLVHEPASVAIAFTDLAGLAPEQREADARALVRELSRRPFDLTRDAQLRASLIRLDAEDHVLLLESHHVASDAWSRGILMRELSALYGAHRRGGEAALAPLPIQYGDYARWQRETLQGAELDRHLAFWREQLRNAPALLELPTDRPRPAAPSFEGALRTRLLPTQLLERLREVSRANGATLFVTLLAAFDVLLSKLSGQRDVVVGTPTAGRSHEATEGLIGFFVNTVALRTRLDGDPAFVELLGRVRETTLSVFEHQDVPFEKLTLELQRAGELGRHGLFQVMFTMQDGESRSVELPGLVCEAYGSSRGATKFDLTLGMQELPSGLRATIEYRTDLFDAGTIDRMLAQLGAVLEAVSETPAAPLSEIALLASGERDLLLREWAGPRRDYPADVSIHGLIEAQVDRTPDAPALTFEGETISYAEMDAYANQLAHLLRQRGVAPGQLVGVCLERSFEMIVALLAIMKAGAAYVPLDPEYPRGRLAFMLDDSTPAATVTRRAERDSLPDDVKQLVVLDDPEVAAALARMPGTRLAERVSGGALAYAIYTSGSTGRPKGALNLHGAVVNRLLWGQETFAFTAADAVMQKTPYSFDVSVPEVFGPLLAGARLVIARPGGHRDPAYLQELVEREGITSIHFVPSMLETFLPIAQRERLATLRIMQCSGEALTPSAIARAYDVLPSGAEVHNLYGPTECAVEVTHWVCPRDPSLSVVPIGRPVANTRCYVLDEAKRLVPVGVPGELYLAGRQVGVGYLLRPELTDERFVVDPYADPVLEPGARMYRTGDRVRWQDDGTIEYLGRLDFQVKIRGLRIELGEIETTLTQQPGVQSAVVVVREDTPGDQRLVAYCVVEPGAEPAAPETLRRALKASLPPFMVPAAFVMLPEWPLNASGKLDRSALPLPAATARRRKYRAARTTIEHELVQVWESLLGVSPIGMHDDFFELGGHSLLAVRMLVEVARLRGRTIPLTWLFESSTIHSLAARIDAEVQGTAEPPIVVLQGDAPGTPIAFVHGDVRGAGWYCRRLAPLLAPDSPFFVLPTLGADGDPEVWTIESMAARHLSELRKVQPHGPYRLAGFCVGGKIVLEMAQQLRAAGETIERLIMIDSGAGNAAISYMRPVLPFITGPDATARLARQAVIMKRVRWYDARIRWAANQELRRQADWLATNVARRARRLVARLRGRKSETNAASPAAPVERAVRDLTQVAGEQVLRRQSDAVNVYIPRRYRGTIDLVWAEPAPNVARRDPTRGWWRVADQVHVHAIVAHHLDLITNKLPDMASVLRAILERAPD
jgi:amino acid adenylation domain-containing protein